MSNRLSILVAARNAEATIARALAGCVDEPVQEIILVDDHCTDHTVDVARDVLGSRCRVVPAPGPGGIPLARQAALDAVDTEFAAWMDADDEWLPGRADRLATLLEGGADVAVDAFDLHDGQSGAWLGKLTAPKFLWPDGAAVRLFERNWLPGDSPVGFRVETYRRAGGYDPSVFGPESYDLLLRAVIRGARFAWTDEVGYRLYAYPGSVSRNVQRQRQAVARALQKHDYETVRALYERAGFGSRVAAWALVSVALFRGEFDAALHFVDDASPGDADPSEVLEPDGPWPFREGWRRAFTRGVCLLLGSNRDRDAADAFADAESLEPTPEAANNLGVALGRLGRMAEARAQWAMAASRLSGYSDARINITARAGSPESLRVTTHPLRRLTARQDYAA